VVYFLPIQFEGERGSSSDGYGVTLPGRRIKRPEIGELFRVGEGSVSRERTRLRDRLSDEGNAADGRFSTACEELTPLAFPFDYSYSIPPLDGASGAKNLKTPDNKNGSL